MKANTPISRLGDKSDHGGEIITATTSIQLSGIPVAKDGDMHRCPIHGDTPITARSYASYDNKPLAHVGAVAGCGAVIVTGSEHHLTHIR